MEAVGTRSATNASFEKTFQSLMKWQWQNIRCLHRSQRWLEPTLQHMVVKEKERREAHWHEIRNAASCVKQLVGKEGCKESLLMHHVCQECSCFPISDMCWFYVEQNAKTVQQQILWCLVWVLRSQVQQLGHVAPFLFSRREAGRRTNSRSDRVRLGRVVLRTPCRFRLSRTTCISPTETAACSRVRPMRQPGSWLNRGCQSSREWGKSRFKLRWVMCGSGSLRFTHVKRSGSGSAVR